MREDNSFDAGWSMSMLMHLQGDGFSRALRELARVIRPGGLLAVGVWGFHANRMWRSAVGHYFFARSDDSLKEALADVGTVEELRTSDWFDDGGHYQWAMVELAGD